MGDETVEMTATMSDEPEPVYRYELGRRWGQGGSLVNFVMLNPSTADASKDDPTLRRCIGFARGWGYDGLLVTNLFAIRSTDPKRIRRAVDPIGPKNDSTILGAARRCGMIVCAWGAHGSLYGRNKAVLRLLRDAGLTPHYLKETGDGHPQHPLYLPGDLHPKPLGPS